MKMIVDNLPFPVILYSMLFICQYYTTEATYLRKESIPEDAKSVILNQDLDLMDFEKAINEPEYSYDEPYDYGDPEKRNSKRQIMQKPEARDRLKDFPKKLPADFYKYRNFLRDLEKNKKSEHLISRSWSAGGMPFNVLYTPNSHQQKILRSIPEKVLISPVNVFPPIGEPMALSAPPPPPPNYDIVQEEINKKEIQKLWPRSSQRPSNRRRYSIIPQLFVSYGWGPTGK